MAKEPNPNDASIPFEEQLKTLESIIDRLENETPPLEEALTAYEEGINLARTCMKRLEQAELKVQSLNENE